MAKMILLVGPPGSGKSTLAKKYEAEGFIRVNQDSQGKGGHQEVFRNAIYQQQNIIVDRMGFNKQQRHDYLTEAKSKGYETEIIVLHESYQTCLARVLARKDHETIKDEKNARGALQVFFTKYERPEAGEADKITFVYPEGPKPKVVVCDLDGTLCNVEHRRHFVRPPANTLVGPDGSMINVLGVYEPVAIDAKLPKFKRDWASFNAEIPNDTINQWCLDILINFAHAHRYNRAEIVFCSGRDDNQRRTTIEWLDKHIGGEFTYNLYMRNRHDSRQDSIIKEIILDFELLTRYEPYFMIDDRQQVVDMWRKRGFTCLQCAEGAF